MSYRITTDSTCDMPREFYTEHSIPCVGLGFQINGKEYREGSEDCMPIHDFYEALRGGAQSTTMQVNTYDFIDFVEPYLQAGEDVLHLCFSSGLSGTYESVERGGAAGKIPGSHHFGGRFPGRVHGRGLAALLRPDA